MKIGLVLPYNITKGGGVKEHALAQQAELLKRGHDVVIITPQPKEPYTPSSSAKVVFLGAATEVKTLMHTVPTISASVLTDDIDNMLDHQQFDILHFHEPWVPVLSRQILSRSKSVNVATFHAKLPETIVSRTMAKVITPYTKPLLRHIDAFTAVSDAAAEYLLSLADVDVEIIPNGIDLEGFQKNLVGAKIKFPLKTILYMGRLENRKGVKYLIRAFAQLQERDPDTQLLIGGDGPDRLKLEQEATELGIKNVEFLGYVDEPYKRQLMRSVDLFCSPAVFGESFGIVLLEAMASGLVTVAGDNPGYESVMQGLGKLSLVNPKDTSLFSHRLQLLLDDHDLRSLWRNWAKDYVKQFDYPKVVDRYEAVYEAALKAAKD